MVKREREKKKKHLNDSRGLFLQALTPHPRDAKPRRPPAREALDHRGAVGAVARPRPRATQKAATGALDLSRERHKFQKTKREREREKEKSERKIYRKEKSNKRT